MRRTTLTLMLIGASLAFAACGMMGGANVNVNVNANANTAKPAEGGTTNSNANTNANANTNTNAAATSTGPKRISFGKGADWGSETVTIPAGGSAQFVVGAKKGQFMDIEASSADVKVLMITKGKSEVEDHPDGIGASLNANGDYVFEVRNLAKKEVKTSVKVTIAAGDTEGDY